VCESIHEDTYQASIRQILLDGNVDVLNQAKDLSCCPGHALIIVAGEVSGHGLREVLFLLTRLVEISVMDRATPATAIDRGGVTGTATTCSKLRSGSQ
jgi:hypothetical protein